MNRFTEQERAQLAAAAEKLTAAPGYCYRCHELVRKRITVAIPISSGPRPSQYACVPCARIYARKTLAPDWLRQDLATIDAADAATKDTGR